MSAIPAGYKQTEVGVIPVDWKASTIGDVASFSGGSQPPRHTFKLAPTHDYIRLIQIRDYKSDDFETYIPNSLARKRCTADDIMIGRYGPPVFQILKGIDGAYNVALIKTVPSDRIDRDYLFYVLKQEKLFQLIDALSRRSSGQTGVEMPALKDYGLPLPTLPEQRAIATALSDMDALLAKLDQLIAKKRDLKQAVMQQLLTGQTRLPGFSGDWALVKAGEIGRFRGGSGFPLQFQGEIFGEYPLFKVSDMNNAGNETFMKTANNYISEALRKLLGATAFPAESIVFAKVCAAVFLERKKILIRASCLDNNMAAFVMDSTRAHCAFIHYVLLNTKLGSLVSTTALPSLSGSVLAAIEWHLPSLPEQTAIATVLSDMDAEVVALETRRDKTRALKQGMMQELLTGRIRLVRAYP